MLIGSHQYRSIPLEPEEALSGLMQVKPPGQEHVKDEEENGESEPETEETS